MALPQRSASTETSTETPAPPSPLHLLPKPGRPSLFNPERTAAICALIQHEGISDSAAGALAGVTATTLARWKLEHEGFALELEAARALFELAQVRAIRAARKRDGTPDWRAAAWLLKHSSPEGYGPLSRMRKVRTEGAPAAEEGGAGHDRAAAGPTRAEADAVPSENCAILPETRRGGGDRAGLNGDRGREEGDRTAATGSQNCANLPETPGHAEAEPEPAGPRLSRRERRAAERRLVKANRVEA